MDILELLRLYECKSSMQTSVHKLQTQNRTCSNVHVWIADQNDHILILRSSGNTQNTHNLWSVICGPVVNNDSSLLTAFRETYEKIGLCIEPEKFIPLSLNSQVDSDTDIWCVKGYRQDFLPIILSSDVVDIFWASWNTLTEMIERHEFVRYDYLESISTELLAIH